MGKREATDLRPWVAELIDDGRDRVLRPLIARRGRETPTPEKCTAEPGTIVAVRGVGAGAQVLSVLAEAGEMSNTILRLAAEHDIDVVYPDAVHAETAAWLEQPGIDDPVLEDLEHLPFVTIDNPDSRDLDQALYLHRSEHGFVVYYALADASYYVAPGSALFAEALERGASFYLPSRSIPMLPRALSEGLISLNEDCPRRSLVFMMDLNDVAECTRTRILRARIRSRKKLSYQRVQRMWDDPYGSSLSREEWADSLELLRIVGRLRIAEAMRRHVVTYQRIELDLGLARSGDLKVEARDRLEVERCNEQISLLCNIEGARLLEEGLGLEYVQPIFRVHPAPTAEDLHRFQEQISALRRVHGLDSRWSWDPEEQPLDEYLRALPEASHPRIAAAIHRQAILTNRRSTFGIEPGSHHGIGAPVYARFSSPMREIVGVFTHKEALELLHGPAAVAASARDVELQAAVVHAANRAKGIQRDLEKASEKLVLDQVFEPILDIDPRRRPGWRATVVGMKPHLLYCRLDDPPIEVKIHLRDLERVTGVRWRSDRHLVEARARIGGARQSIRVGSGVDLTLVDYDRERERWLLKPRI